MGYVEVNSEILHQNLRKSHRFSSKPISMLESMGISIQRVSSLKCFNYRMLWEDAQSTPKHTTVVNKKKMSVYCCYMIAKALHKGMDIVSLETLH